MTASMPPAHSGPFRLGCPPCLQAFPICLPGTTVWKARQGRIYIFSVLKTAASRAREHIKASAAAGWQLARAC